MENKILISVLDFIVQSSDGKTKKKFLGYILSKKHVLEKGKGATFEFTTPVQGLLNTCKVFRNPGTKIEVENDLFSCLDPLTVDSCNQMNKNGQC